MVSSRYTKWQVKWDVSDERWIGAFLSETWKNGKICLFLDDIEMNW